MGFFNSIIKIIWGTNYGPIIQSLSDGISDLRSLIKRKEKELEEIQNSAVEIPDFKIKATVSQKKNKNIASYVPPKNRPIRSMKDLLEKRKKEETERIKLLRIQVGKKFDEIQNLIDNEKVEQAETLMIETSALLESLKDKSFYNLYEEILSSLTELKAELHQREIERREEEARRKAAEEARREEEARQRRQREEEERQRREREAREYEERLARDEEKRNQEIKRLTTLVQRKKPDKEEILEYLKLKRIRCFYHFTDRQNLNSIKRMGGLYSWHYCVNNNIKIPNPGGDNFSRRLDVRNGLQDYVRLSFCNDHPMAYRLLQDGADLVLLKISIDVATFKDTIFTDRNAASSSFASGKGIEALQNVNIYATQRDYVSRSEGDTFFEHQAECMVKTFVPLKYIVNINNPDIMK